MDLNTLQKIQAVGLAPVTPSSCSYLPRHPRVRLPTLPQEQDAFSFKWVSLFLLLHLALGVFMKQVHMVATFHALLALSVGLWLCLRKNHPLQILQWVAYVVGAEVLWRMCKASIPWEFAKHAIWVVCLISLVRSGGVRGSWFPVFYFLFLVPASALTFVDLPPDEARKQVSFYLAAPLCLALCAVRCSSLQLTARGLQRIGIMLLGPVAGIAFIGFFRLATTEAEFGTSSNFAASGGYGPNQVSAMLGLGAILALFLYLAEKRSYLLKGLLLLLTLWLLGQSALTFSRTGIYLFVAAFGIASVFLLQSKGGAGRLLLLLMVLGATTCVVLPFLDIFTDGKLADRFNDKGLTGRDSLAKLDLQIWRQNPLIGVGVGMSMSRRAEVGDDHAAHTEYTRLLADHGLLGAGALVLLLLMTVQAFLRAREPLARAIVAAFAFYAFLFMAVSAMRLAAPAFLLALIHARFLVGGSAAATKASSFRSRTVHARRARIQIPGLVGSINA